MVDNVFVFLAITARPNRNFYQTRSEMRLKATRNIKNNGYAKTGEDR